MALQFRKQLIAAESFESAKVFDVDGDGVMDLVSGGFWYQGPDFRIRRAIAQVPRYGEYYDDFSTIPMDIAGRGRLDLVTGGWWGGSLRWYENPIDPADLATRDKPWPEHIVGTTSSIETTRAWDVDGDGELEIVPNEPLGPLQVFKLRRDAQGKPAGAFDVFQLTAEPQGHGLGFGDIAGDGRPGLVLKNGWLQPPPRGNRLQEPWTFHAEWNIEHLASVPMLVVDVDGDWLNDLIVGNAHGYGLDWYRQTRQGGRRRWSRIPIDPFCSQYHDLHWADIDGDGKPELVTGSRYRAHNGRDPGEHEPIGVYYFKWTGHGFAKQVIAHGMPGEGVGTGIHFDLHDLRGSGRLDVIAPGKDGLHILWNEG